MTILDKFLILFESDAGDTAEDVEKLDKSLDETAKGATTAITTISKLSTQMADLSSTSRSAASDLDDAGSMEINIDGADAASQDIDDLSTGLNDLSSTSNEINIDGAAASAEVDTLTANMDALSSTSNEINIDGAAASAEVDTLTANMDALSSSSKSAAADLAGLAKEEIVVTKQTDGLKELSQKLSEISEVEALELGKKLGLTQTQVMTLRKGSEGVKKLSNELKGVKEPTSSAAKQFTAMGVKALGAIGGIVALGSAIGGLISTAARIDEVGKFADLIGENIEDVDAWGGAVVRAGGTVDGFRSTVESMNEKMVETAIKGESEITPFFKQLGISITDTDGKIKTTLDILPELAGAFEGLNRQESLGIGKKLGLDQGTIMLLQSGPKAIDAVIKRQKMLGLATAEASMASAEFNDILADFSQMAGFVAQNLLLTFAPAVTWTIDKLLDLSMWARENKMVIYGFFLGLAVVAIPSLISLAAAGWTAIAPFLVMAAPFIAIAAAAAAAGVAITLVVEDIMAFVNGQESLLGQILEKWPIIGDVIKAVVDDVTEFVEIIKAFGTFLLDIFVAPEKALKTMTNTVEILKKAIEGISSKALEKLTGAVSGVKSFFGFGDDELKKNISMGQGSITAAAESPIAAASSNSIINESKASNKTTTVQVGDITVNTQATDAEGVAGAIGGSLEDQMKTTVDSFDDGVAI